MYVHTNYKDSLFINKRDEACIFSTRPLDLQQWNPLQMNTLMGYQDGELKFMGTHHENEFFDNEEKLRMIFRDYAKL